jgi:lysophospholipase L1-like esterase
MVKISELPTITAVASDDLIPINDASLTRTSKVTLANLASGASFSGSGDVWSSLPHFGNAISRTNDASPTDIHIIGLGSSVGAGATLDAPEDDAPSAYLAAQLTAKLDVLSNLSIGHTNGSVGGSTLSACISGDDLDDAITAATVDPKLVLLSFGMNDAMPSQYHTGQTYPAAAQKLKQLIRQIHMYGSDAVIATTPHPNTDTYDFTYGGATTYPGSEIPDESNSVVTIPWKGGTIDVSYRHLRMNQLLRQTAAELGCAVVDTERYWFDALLGNDVNDLFDEVDDVHPNLLGHQLSFHKAIDGLVSSMVERPAVAFRPTAPIVIVKEDDTTVTNTVTKADVVGFEFFARAYGVYSIEVDLFYTAATAADIEVQWDLGGAGGTFVWGLMALGASATGSSNQQYVNAVGNQSHIAGLTLGGAGQSTYARLAGTFTCGTTKGAPKLTFAQKVADASDATIFAGSTMRITEANKSNAV